jgi:hypothetical protein
MYRENRGIAPRLGRSVLAETATGNLSIRRWMVLKIGKSRSPGGTEPGPCSSWPDQAPVLKWTVKWILEVWTGLMSLRTGAGG